MTEGSSLGQTKTLNGIARTLQAYTSISLYDMEKELVYTVAGRHLHVHVCVFDIDKQLPYCLQCDTQCIYACTCIAARLTNQNPYTICFANVVCHLVVHTVHVV